MNEFDADVIVVGSGIIGGLISHQLACKGLSVALLEAGPSIDRSVLSKADGLEAPENPNKLYPSSTWAPSSHEPGYLQFSGNLPYEANYIRAVGGTTWRWAAACWRFVPNDFKSASLYGRGRDWPIGYDDLEPFYLRAELEFGVTGSHLDDQLGKNGNPFPPRSGPYPKPHPPLSFMDNCLAKAFAGSEYSLVQEPSARNHSQQGDRCTGCNQCMRICPNGSQYGGIVHVERAVQNGVLLFDNAVVTDLKIGRRNRIERVVYKEPDGSEHSLSARIVILAANGLETPKLLLLCGDRDGGVANSSGMVGRNLMDHPGTQGVIITNTPIRPGDGPVQMSCVMAMRDGLFRKDHAAIKHSFRNQAPQSKDLTIALGRELSSQEERDLTLRWLDISSVYEQLPDPSNLIRPSSTIRDGLGIPVPDIAYQIDAYTGAGAKVAVRDYHNIARLVGGTLAVSGERWQNRDHIMGTTIMGADPRDSVVDADCRTHDHPNLYIAGTSVFTTGAVAKPTLTAAALALKMVESVVCDI